MYMYMYNHVLPIACGDWVAPNFPVCWLVVADVRVGAAVVAVGRSEKKTAMKHYTATV